MKNLLEYNEEHSQFHYNYLENDGKWHQPPFTYGWKPIAIISDDLSADGKFLTFLDELSRQKHSFEKAALIVLTYLMTHE